MNRLRSSLLPCLRLPLLPVWAAPLLLLAPVYLTGRVLFWGVPLLQFVPWWKAAWDSLLAGRLPLWNPWVGMGAPLLANYQSALLYPPTWSYLVAYALGGVGAMAWMQAVLLALHLAWAGIGMACLARRVGVSELGQAVAGLAYGLSGYLVGRASFLSINAATAWLPWILFCLTPLPGPLRLGSRRFLLAAACIAMQLLAGHAQTTWYSLLLAGLWVVFWAWQMPGQLPRQSPQPLVRPVQRARSVLRAVGVMGLAVLLAVVIAAAQLLPTAEYLTQSQRSSAVDYEYAMNYSFWPWHILTLLAPGLFGSPVTGDYWGYAYIWEDALYVGLLPLLLALGARRRTDPRSQTAVFGRRSSVVCLWLLFALALLFALGDNTPVFPWLYRHVPTFAMFQAPARWMLWGVAALALLAGLGVDGWQRPEGRGLYWTRLGTMGAVAITLGAGLAWTALGEVSPSFIRAIAWMGWWALCAGVLSLTAPPRPGRAGPAAAPKPAAKLRLQALAGLEARLGQGLARLSARFNWPGQGYPLRRWQAAVTVVITLDLLVAGWGLNPPGDPQVYTRPAPTAADLKAALGISLSGGQEAAGRRLYMPAPQETWFTYTRFLRRSAFDPGQDWMDLRAGELPNENILDAIPSAGNYDPLVPGRFAAWLEALADAPPETQQRVLGLMDVGLTAFNRRFAPHGLLFQPTAAPTARARWAGCAWIAADVDDARRRVFDGSVDFTRQVVLEAADAPTGPECSSPQADGSPVAPDIQVAYDGPNRLNVQLTTPAAGWLVLSEAWYPGWRATVDGAAVPTLRANAMFRALWLAAGPHQVVFEYRPASFWAGLALSLVGLLAFIGLWVTQKDDPAN